MKHPILRQTIHWTLVAAICVLSTAKPSAAAGGDSANPSSAEALRVADRVMDALGGQAAWENTRYLRWRFFGRRSHLWDKHTGRVRIEGEDRETGDRYLILMNLHTGQGRVWLGGEEITDSGSVAEWLDRGQALWINDSYWLVMPYKLRDPGVVLRHLGHRPLEDGRTAEVLELTFQAVGRTPENKYHIFVDQESSLVVRWDYFRNADDGEPQLSTPWGNWQRYGEVLLPSDFGDWRHSDVAVFETLPDRYFTDPQPPGWGSISSP